MNEPLIETTPAKPFSGKTYNNHPHWSNQPLRLTEKQLNNPILAFDDFFECYHLNETREILWQWLTVVISSESISNEPLERSNHIYLYEKLEEVIEAAFVMKTNQPKGETNTTSKDNIHSIQPTHPVTTADVDEIFNKEKRLIEYAVEAPLYVIHEVFTTQREFTSNQLMAWLQIALTSDSSAYECSQDREQLKNFHDDLLSIVDALYIIFSNNVEKLEGEKPNPHLYQVSVLSEDQIASPEIVIRSFFSKYSVTYIDRELEDWLESAICYTGKWPNDLFCHAQLLDVHRYVLCLIKAADQLLSKGSSIHS